MKITSSALFFATLFLLQTSSALAEDFPKRKAGLWETKTQVPMMNTTLTSKECVSPEVDKQMLSVNKKGMSDCTTDTSKSGNSYIMNAKCKSQGMDITANTVLSGNFNSSYKGTVTTTMVGGPMQLPPQKISLTAKYIGDCPADMKPGDIVTSGVPGLPGSAQKLNVLELGK